MPWPSGEEIDALNVYPCPTGTPARTCTTVSAARDALREATGGGDPDTDRTGRPRRAQPGALLGARGNSGVILSDMLGALCRRIAQSSPANTQRPDRRRRAAAGG